MVTPQDVVVRATAALLIASVDPVTGAPTLSETRAREIAEAGYRCSLRPRVNKVQADGRLAYEVGEISSNAIAA